MSTPPLIGVTCDVSPADDRARVKRAYIDALVRAGAAPVLLAPCAGSDPQRTRAHARALAAACDAVVLTGGDDPRTERYGEPTHPRANPVHPDRQAFEEALLATLDEPALAHKPVLGVCLGMQMMALHRGGSLVQHMPDEVATHADHFDDAPHEIVPDLAHRVIGRGVVTSWHRQCVRSAGSMRVVARAPDRVIEAIDDPARPFYLGVQWHPERTTAPALGDDVFAALVEATRVS